MKNILKNRNNLKRERNSIMTSTLMHQKSPHQGWTNDRVCLPYNNNKMSTSDSSGLKKAIMKMLVFDENNSSSKNNSNTIANFITNGGNSKTNMSLLKFFAINALELSAPASPVLLQQTSSITPGWLQLSGHPESIAPAANGVVRKRITGPADSEAIAYRGITKDPHASKVIPKFLGVCEINGDSYIELEDLLNGFKDPHVMDIKMGCRTFLESEVTTKMLRPDLYKKMIAVDPNAPTEEEHKLKAITKLRYMMFREQLSSSQIKGYRIEALKIKGYSPVTDLKTVRSDPDIEAIIAQFVNGKKNVTKELIRCLKQMRSLIEKSDFFHKHEVVGSSVFIVYDEDHIGAWLIDFAKCHPLPDGIKVNHRNKWVPGNCEEGLLHGMDELIKTFEAVHNSNHETCKIN